MPFTMFCAWVVFMGGARRLEGSWFTNLFFWLKASQWSDTGIKIFVGGTWIVSTVGMFLWMAMGRE